MTWNNSDQHNPVYTCTETKVELIYQKMSIVVSRLIQNDTDVKIETTKEILIYVDATNGYVKFSWYSSEEEGEIGNYSSMLYLPELWSL